VAAGFNGPNVNVNPLLAGAASSLHQDHTAVAQLPLQPPTYSGPSSKLSGVFGANSIFKGKARSNAVAAPAPAAIVAPVH
jgi:hypothetical protein